MIICTDLLHTASSGLNDDSLIDEVLTDKKTLPQLCPRKNIIVVIRLMLTLATWGEEGKDKIGIERFLYKSLLRETKVTW